MPDTPHTVVINGKLITDISAFYTEINRVLMYNEDWKIAESLDAFNDLLYGGFGKINATGKTEIIWQDIAVSREALGYEATRKYYLTKLLPGSPFNKSHFREKLTKLESGNGQSYFDIILEIIAQHPHIILHKK